MALVYKITNLENKKVYIGWTSKTLEQRWNEHIHCALKNQDNRKFYNAIRKYKLESWKTEIICEVDTNDIAKQKEIEYIAILDSYNKGYNATKGGDGNNGIIMSAESNLRRSKALKGIPKSEDTVKKFKNRKSTPEQNLKRSKSHLGTKKPWVKWNKDQVTKRAMTRRSLTKEQFDHIHLLRDEGLLIREIAEKTNLTNDLVKKWLKRVWDL